MPGAERPSLTIQDVDTVLVAIQGATGPGSLGARAQLMRELLERATEAEQVFLVGLLAGELRQGALEGVMVDAIAKAAGVPRPVVRRAVMLSGELPQVALYAFEGGEAALEQIDLELFRPVLPMLAQTADDPGCSARAEVSSPFRREAGRHAPSAAPARREGGALQPILAPVDALAPRGRCLRTSPAGRRGDSRRRDHAVCPRWSAAWSRCGDGTIWPANLCSEGGTGASSLLSPRCSLTV